MTPPPLFDARAYLQGLVGQTISTITGRPNTIIAVRDDHVFVRTQDTATRATGEPVPIEWVQNARDALYANGRVETDFQAGNNRGSRLIDALTEPID